MPCSRYLPLFPKWFLSLPSSLYFRTPPYLNLPPSHFLPLSSRAGMFVTKFFEGCVPKMELQQEDKKLLALVGWELKQYIELMDKVK